MYLKPTYVRYENPVVNMSVFKTIGKEVKTHMHIRDSKSFFSDPILESFSKSFCSHHPARAAYPNPG